MKPEPPLEPPSSYWDEPEEDSAPESWLDRFLNKGRKTMLIIDLGEYVRERRQQIFDKTFDRCDCIYRDIMGDVLCINCHVYSCFYEYLRMTGDINEKLLQPIPNDFSSEGEER